MTHTPNASLAPLFQRRVPVLVATMLALTVPSLAPAQGLSGSGHWFDQSRYQAVVSARDNHQMRELVRPLSEAVESSVVQVFSGGRIVALGTVVAEDGYLITKRSELSGDPISVRVPNGQKVSAWVTAVRRSNDLALLKLDSDDQSDWGIEPAKFAIEETPTGSFLISADRDGRTIGLGVLGVPARAIDHQGRLGVNFYDSPTGPAMVRRVAPASGADEAGLRGGDQIVQINGKSLTGSRSAIKTLGNMYPGEVVRLTILRGDDTIEVSARMSDQAMLMESQNDAKVNGPRNLRLSGFDSVFQHDTVLAPNQCGGPVLDSRGRVVGINIARAGRVVSYALPSSLVTAEIISMLEEARRR